MLTKLKNYILQIHQSSGVEICFLPDGEILVNLSTVKIQKGKLIKLNEFHHLHNLSDLKGKIPKGSPIAVVISGKGILYKQIPLSNITQNPFELILPTANPGDFHTEIINFQEKAFITIIRKKILEKTISNLKHFGYKILSVSLCGIKEIDQILPLIDPNIGSLYSTFYKFERDPHSRLSDLTTIPFDKNSFDKIEYNIGDQYVFSPALVSFSAATLIIANPLIESSSNIDSVYQERRSFVYFKFFRAALWSGLLFLFVLLLTNFLLFEYYFTNNRNLEIGRNLLTSENEKKNDILKSISRKEDFLKSEGWTKQSKLSLNADRVASMVPDGITLTSMNINPVYTNDYMYDNSALFKKDTIDVNGTCDDPTELNLFSDNLKTASPFKSIVVKNYFYKKESGKGLFLVEITAK
jgi:hypothetical protein